MAGHDVEDGITVTTATRTEDQVREELGLPAAAPKPAAEPDATATPELEAEAASTKTDAEISEAARTLRGRRSDKRVSSIQDEIDALTRQKNDAKAELDRLRREHAKFATPPPAGTSADAAKPTADGSSAPTTPIADGSSAPPPFKFPLWEEYQAQHPEAEYHEFLDARTDARYAYNDQVKEERTKRESAARDQEAAFTAVDTATAAFKAEHADFDTVTGRVQLLDTPASRDLSRLLLLEGSNAPRMLYYLGLHPEEATRLMQATSRQALFLAFGETKYAAKVWQVPAAEAAAASRPPARPVTDSPAPLDPVRGGAHHSPTLQTLADSGDDADAYIAARRQQMKAAS